MSAFLLITPASLPQVRSPIAAALLRGKSEDVAMSQSLFAYLNHAPSLDEITAELSQFGLCYRHTLPPDERWDYPMHVFGLGDLRVVYHAGDPDASRAIVDTTVRRGDTDAGAAQLRLVATRVIQRWGGEVYDPHLKRRLAVN